MQHDKLFWGVLFLAAAGILMLVLACGGCDSQTARPEVSPETDTETDTETENTATAGDNSIIDLQEIIVTMQQTINEIKQVTMQTQKSAATSADEIDTLVNNIDNTHNSSWLMFGVVLVLIAGGVVLIIVLMKMRIRITRAIDSPDNSLTREQYRAY